MFGHAYGNTRLSKFPRPAHVPESLCERYAVFPADVLQELASMHEEIVDVIRRSEVDAAESVMAEHILAPTDLHARYYRSAIAPDEDGTGMA
jgi:DNA-binding GntR family transcriptional regulator